jgi:hypothetical protein
MGISDLVVCVGNRGLGLPHDFPLLRQVTGETSLCHLLGSYLHKLRLTTIE